MTNASISDVNIIRTNANIDLKSAKIRINVRQIHATKRMASVISNQLGSVIANLRVILVRVRNNAVATRVKRRNANNSYVPYL